jgi:hypothetical protein
MRTNKSLALFLAASGLISCGESVAPTNDLGPSSKQAPGLAVSPTAVKYAISVVDPANDTYGAFPIDVSQMDLVFDPANGDYQIVLRTYAGSPFLGTFRININLFDVDAGIPFGDVLNDYDLASSTDSILLTGNAPQLATWQTGDRVYTNSLAGTPNPPGASLYRSSVSAPTSGFLDFEDVIAFADLAQPAIVKVAVLSPAEQVNLMLDEVQALISSAELASSKANGLLAKLRAVLAKIERGQAGAAINQLGAFANQVSAFARAGVLSESIAQRLRDEAANAASQLAPEDIAGVHRLRR